MSFQVGHKVSEDVRRKLRLANLGKHYSEETIKKRIASRQGYKHSEETKKKIGLASLGKHSSEETKQKLRLARLGVTWGKHSEEWKRKASKRMIGNKNPNYKKQTWNKGLKGIYLGKDNPFYGKKHSEETRIKMRENHADFSGEKSPVWKGGISFEPYGKEFNKQLKEQIRQRDDHRCQQCFHHQNDLNKNLTVHHIDFNKKNNDSSNLISLCNRCHSQTNFNRDGWTNYFQDAIELRGLK